MHSTIAYTERAAVIDALGRALDIAVTTGRVTGPEFDEVSRLIAARDRAIAAERELAPYEIGQLMGGN